MLSRLTGVVQEILKDSFVLDVHGLGFAVFTNRKNLEELKTGDSYTVFTSLYVKEGGIEVYGFLDHSCLNLFEMLKTVQGVGPKTALAILNIDTPEYIMAAILEKRADVLEKAAGVGTKTAERIIVDLKSRMKISNSSSIVEKIDENTEVEEALASLGYPRQRVRQVLEKIPRDTKNIEDRIKAALKALSGSARL